MLFTEFVGKRKLNPEVFVDRVKPGMLTVQVVNNEAERVSIVTLSKDVILYITDKTEEEQVDFAFALLDEVNENGGPVELTVDENRRVIVVSKVVSKDDKDILHVSNRS